MHELPQWIALGRAVDHEYETINLLLDDMIMVPIPGANDAGGADRGQAQRGQILEYRAVNDATPVLGKKPTPRTFLR